ncbi:Sodium/myo-inositol cotransporter 2 [Acropora cervicornis]|uniref:Sodium/myo-inositol cotransporter 2 n=1 Tax=Acropora cervicornis TaxID=6130 RepID=A0AAD9Q3P6_ACRCE|nr:Sodium/myo-inositol cotransporter 2 [Acropora cervicornis]
MVFVDEEQRSMHIADWIVIGVYFLGCIIVGLWSKFRKQKGRDETAETYFLAGRSMMWWAVGPSLFASNMGSEHFVGLAGSGAATGIAASWILLLLGWVFLPIYLRSRVFTMPEYLQKRFQSHWIRTYLTAVALISYVFTKTSCVIMIIGAIVLSVLTTTMTTTNPNITTAATTLANTVANMTTSSLDTSCYKMTPYWSNMFRPLDDPDYPWLGLWITLPILGVWYWCTDQVIVQRALGAKNNTHAKAGAILAGFFKILPMFVMVMPGMISRVLFPDSIACPDPESCKFHCGNEFGCTNNAYPKLVLNVLPIGLVGLMMAVMMAALMSSLSSVFNSSGTIFTVDVWLRFRPRASEREQVIVGRVVVVVLVVLSICWLPIIQGSAGTQLFVYIQKIQSYLSPPITMVFVLGILWPGLTATGALSGLLVGFLLGMAKFIVGNVYADPHCGEVDSRPGFAKMHFMYYAMVIFSTSGLIMVVVSFFTKKVPRDELGGLTWPTIDDPPISHGAIGEEVECERVENGNARVAGNSDGIELLKKVDKTEENHNNPDKGADDDEDKQEEPCVTSDKVHLTVVQFAREDPILKTFLRVMSLLLLFVLTILWMYYR